MPIILYCDVDGVFTEIDKALKRRFGRYWTNLEHCYNKLEQLDPSFFATLPFYPSRRILWELLLKNRFDTQGNPVYAIRIIQGGQDRWAYDQRRKWIHEHLLKHGSETNIIIEDKLSCEKSTVLEKAMDLSGDTNKHVLLDDRQRWIDEWLVQGKAVNCSHGILFVDAKSAFEGLIGVLGEYGVSFNKEVIKADLALLEQAMAEENGDPPLSVHNKFCGEMGVVDLKDAIPMKDNLVDLTGDSSEEFPQFQHNVINLIDGDPMSISGVGMQLHGPSVGPSRMGIMNDMANYDFEDLLPQGREGVQNGTSTNEVERTNLSMMNQAEMPAIGSDLYTFVYMLYYHVLILKQCAPILVRNDPTFNSRVLTIAYNTLIDPIICQKQYGCLFVSVDDSALESSFEDIWSSVTSSIPGIPDDECLQRVAHSLQDEWTFELAAFNYHLDPKSLCQVNDIGRTGKAAIALCVASQIPYLKSLLEDTSLESTKIFNMLSEMKSILSGTVKPLFIKNGQRKMENLFFSYNQLDLCKKANNWFSQFAVMLSTLDAMKVKKVTTRDGSQIRIEEEWIAYTGKIQKKLEEVVMTTNILIQGHTYFDRLIDNGKSTYTLSGIASECDQEDYNALPSDFKDAGLLSYYPYYWIYKGLSYYVALMKRFTKRLKTYCTDVEKKTTANNLRISKCQVELYKAYQEIALFIVQPEPQQGMEFIKNYHICAQGAIWEGIFGDLKISGQSLSDSRLKGLFENVIQRLSSDTDYYGVAYLELHKFKNDLQALRIKCGDFGNTPAKDQSAVKCIDVYMKPYRDEGGEVYKGIQFSGIGGKVLYRQPENLPFSFRLIVNSRVESPLKQDENGQDKWTVKLISHQATSDEGITVEEATILYYFEKICKQMLKDDTDRGEEKNYEYGVDVYRCRSGTNPLTSTFLTGRMYRYPKGTSKSSSSSRTTSVVQEYTEKSTINRNVYNAEDVWGAFHCETQLWHTLISLIVSSFINSEIEGVPYSHPRPYCVEALDYQVEHLRARDYWHSRHGQRMALRHNRFYERRRQQIDTFLHELKDYNYDDFCTLFEQNQIGKDQDDNIEYYGEAIYKKHSIESDMQTNAKKDKATGSADIMQYLNVLGSKSKVWRNINIHEMACLALSIGGTNMGKIVKEFIKQPYIYNAGAPDLTFCRLSPKGGKECNAGENSISNEMSAPTARSNSVNSAGELDLQGRSFGGKSSGFSTASSEQEFMSDIINCDAFVIEAKSKNDTIKPNQVAWLSMLKQAGLPSYEFHVTDNEAATTKATGEKRKAI